MNRFLWLRDQRNFTEINLPMMSCAYPNAPNGLKTAFKFMSFTVPSMLQQLSSHRIDAPKSGSRFTTKQLYTPRELEQLHHDLPYLRNITGWLINFLAKPHPDLGRSGPVCPFLPRALQLQTIEMAVIRTQNLSDLNQIEEIVKHHRDVFLELEPCTGELALYKSILLLFPDLSKADFPVIDQIQQRLKPFFVKEGLMIGEFHQQNESGGLHNPDFRPLQSPVPMLAIRFMVESDLPFLDRATDQSDLRIQYLEAYLRRLGTLMKDENKLNHARLALARAKAQGEYGNLEPTQSASRCPFAKLTKAFREFVQTFQLAVLPQKFSVVLQKIQGIPLMV